MPNGPDFSFFRSVSMRNLKTGSPAELVRLDLVEPTSERLDEITRACNEPLIYDFLFRRSLNGDPYPPSMAVSFMEDATRAWRENRSFVFVVLDPAGRIVGNIDIEANTLDAAEIGYWATSASPGFITPAVAALCDIAARAGFKSLFAHTRPYNERSMGVLRRNGFQDVGLVGEGPDQARKFIRPLRRVNDSPPAATTADA